jgi:hypothetical protein
MGAIVGLERESAENSVADAAVNAPCLTRMSPLRSLLTREDFEGGAGVLFEEALDFEFPPFLRFFRLVCFPMSEIRFKEQFQICVGENRDDMEVLFLFNTRGSLLVMNEG